MKSNSQWSKFKLKAITLLSALLAGVVGGERAWAQSWMSTNLLGNWTSVAMAANGSEIAAASYLGGIYTSTNGGTNWTGSGMLDPGRPVLAASATGSNLVAAFFDGNIFTSSNWGANSNWVQTSAPINYWNCLAASADGSQVLAGTFPGYISKSTNGGESWAQTGAAWDYWQSLASSASGNNLLAASHFGYVYSSTNAGETWDELAIGLGSTNIISSDTLYLNVVYTNLNISVSDTNRFVTNRFNPVLTIPIITVSSNSIDLADGIGIGLIGTAASGTNVMSVTFTVDVEGSNVFDVNPLITDALGRVGSTAPTSITNHLAASFAIPNGTGIFNTNGALNTNSISILNTNISGIGLSMTNVLNVEVAIGNTPQSWSAVASSADGSHLAASVNGGLVYTSTNSGATWAVADLPATNWSAVTISADGSYLTAVASSGLLYTSSNGGSSWVAVNVPSTDWSAVALSADGSVQAAVAYGGGIYYDDRVVTPPVPRITSITRADENTMVYFTTVNGATYTLCCTNSSGLPASVTNWPSGLSLTGDGGTDQLSDTGTDATRFYRVVAHH
jgi:hypothetical protein